MDFGRAVRVLRAIRNYSQLELAHRMNTHAAIVCRLESGVRDTPSVKTLSKLATALDVPMYMLVLLASDREDLGAFADEQIATLGPQLLSIILKKEESV